MLDEKKVPLQCYTKSQLALMYGVCTTTFRKWVNGIENKLKTANYRRSQITLTPKQVSIIFDELNPPNYANYCNVMNIKL